MQRLGMGSLIKCFALYDRPFWRNRPAHPIDPDHLLFYNTIDATPYDERNPALVAFIGGDAVLWSDKPFEICCRAVLEDLALVFGEEALYPKLYFDHDWRTEPFIGGGYHCYAPPGGDVGGVRRVARPDWAHPLGRNRDRPALLWLHRRGHRGWRTGGSRGAGALLGNSRAHGRGIPHSSQT